MPISSDTRAGTLGAIVELFILDASAVGGPVYRFANQKNQLGNDIVWAGATYTAIPIKAFGFDKAVNGAIPRPTIKVSNVAGFLIGVLDTYDDLVGAKLTRQRTLAKYLDAVNFPGNTNPHASTSEKFEDEIFYVQRKVLQNRLEIEFELSSSFDLEGLMLPRRLIIPICPWIYRSAECGYLGGAVAKQDDTATAILAEDKCGKRISSCKLRFGTNATLPHGGFPTAGVTR